MKRVLLLSCVCTLGNVCATERESLPEDLYSGFCVGAGVSFSRTIDKSNVTETDFDAVPTQIQDRKINKAGGNLSVGYGQCLADKYYVGGELSLDVSGNKSYRGTYYFGGKNRYSGKVRGIVPSAVVKLGYCVTPSVMAYLRGGIAHVKSDFTDGSGKIIYNYTVEQGHQCYYYGSDVNVSKVVPVVGFGVEQKLKCGFGLRLEGDYRFNAKKTSLETIVTDSSRWRLGVRNRVSGFTARLVGTYTLKF